ncbi:hypothetical protein JHN55_11805 [Streptomyces sp. MBT56]|uniref:hypothetical protein n=1 Tax=unclassified Streptomyces TaxID=2593676 RepID=UPI00190A5C8C|nr:MULTISPECIES: hypothetical protein [unclassified Streptomyces]MBK3557202.1 hypothetical protein [Streptomyces sp. MBT56]MBK3600363.1 hypothetical protein [Streptomyces sp. MBT54]MBK3617880.1 hypothetical protein [Streptomyces sp. MBT98]
MAVTQKAPLGSTVGDNVTAPAWRNRPVWYQFSTQDRMIHPDNERHMYQRMNPAGSSSSTPATPPWPPSRKPSSI